MVNGLPNGDTQKRSAAKDAGRVLIIIETKVAHDGS